MANKKDKRIIPFATKLTPVVHFQLKKIAELHNRSMNDEVIYLVEEAARDMLLDLNWNDNELKKNIEKAAANLGMSEDEYVENEKKDYVKRREIQAGVHYYDGPEITWEEIIRDRHTGIVLRSDKEIQDGFIEIGEGIQKYRKNPFPEQKNQPIHTKDPTPAYDLSIKEEFKDNIVFFDLGVIEIPLLGSTAAGQPINFGDPDPDPVTRPWATPLIKGKRKDYYCVLIKGNSMTEADIKDGDYVLIRHTDKAEHGEIMLIRQGESSTLKKIKIAEGKDRQAEIFICWMDGSGHEEKLEGENCEVQGRLVAVERKRGKR